jgi:glycerol kinase
VRAALEAMAFGTADLLSAIQAGSGVEVPVLRVDGGASANDFLMQHQADLLGFPVERPTVLETTALGAAGLAGLATGMWQSMDEVLAAEGIRRFAPAMATADRRRRIAEWERAVAAALAWARWRPTH